jgi:hypothetical protein
MFTEPDLIRKLDLLANKMDEMTNLLTQLVERKQRIPNDGPQSPDRLWVGGVQYEGFTSPEYRLLECLWGRTAVSTTDVMDCVWGDDENRDNALRKLVQRTKKKLVSKRVPVTIAQRNQQLLIVTTEPS